jgi:hypothetical protein
VFISGSKLEINMKKLTEQDGKSLDMLNENLEALKAIFPEAFTENGVDFEVLRQLLGDAVDVGEEKGILKSLIGQIRLNRLYTRINRLTMDF